MVGWLVALLWGLERKYDESDYRKVDELIVASGAPWSLEKELLARHPDNAPRCEKSLISSFRGLVRVTCAPAGEDPYRFQADLVRRQLNGEDPRSADVIAAVERKRLAADAGMDAGAPPRRGRGGGEPSGSGRRGRRGSPLTASARRVAFPAQGWVPTFDVRAGGGGMGRGLVLFWLVLAPVALGGGRGGEDGDGERFWLEAKNQRVRQQRSELARVAKRARGAVVSITTVQAPTSESVARGDAGNASDPQKGLGAGFIIHPDGYILTSQHVVENAAEIRVALMEKDGTAEEHLARVVGADAQTDFALLKIDAPRKLPVLRLGSVRHVDIADWVVVIGNPFGLGQSVTVGVVSYKGRQDVKPSGRNGYFDYLQTDASINPGNSGGPILDLHGDVVAIANAVNVAGQGIGFGIPIDMAKAILPQLKEHGGLRRGWLGIGVEDGRRGGVLVSEVMDGGPAARAGLLVGDVIQGVNKARVNRALALRWEVAASGAGQWVRLRVRRGDHPFFMRVRLEDVPLARPGERDRDDAGRRPVPGAASRAGGQR